MDSEDDEYYTLLVIQDQEKYVQKGGFETTEHCPECGNFLWHYENNDSNYISLECIVCSYQRKG